MHPCFKFLKVYLRDKNNDERERERERETETERERETERQREYAQKRSWCQTYILEISNERLSVPLH